MSAPQSAKIPVTQESDALIPELTADELSEMLVRFERQYGMTSDEFKIRWEQGDMPDTFETNFWAILLK